MAADHRRVFSTEKFMSKKERKIGYMGWLTVDLFERGL